MKIPKSVQQVIPAKRIWMDGIWLVGNKYSKCWRFTDINYAIASKDDKTSMFLDYSELLNALDSSATTKITICNKQMNKQAFEESILLPLQGDQYDGYRKEYNNMLLDKVTDVSNSIVQERYITVSVAVKDIDEARSYFNRVGTDLSTHLSQLSSSCEELSSVERMRIFHDFFRAGEEVNYSLDLKQMIRHGNSFRDYIFNANGLRFTFYSLRSVANGTRPCAGNCFRRYRAYLRGRGACPRRGPRHRGILRGR